LDSVLVVSSDKKSTEYLYDLLRDEQLSIIESAENTSFIHRDYDLVIIDIPFENDFGLKTAVDISESMGADVIIVVPKESEKELESKSEKYGIFVISKPVDENILKKSLHFLRAMRQKLGGVQKENVKLKKQIDNIRLINRAKYILMEYLSMTEPQAHRYLEKQAMDLRITKAEVAKRLLSTYEN